MIDFLKESDTFAGITFSGCYDMPFSHFEGLYNHYKKTGQNLLDDYSFIVHKRWERDEEGLMMSRKEFEEAFNKISRIRALHLGNSEGIHEAMYICRQQLKSFIRWENYNSTREVKRRRANKFTGNEEIRNAVFELHGSDCLKCGSSEKIQLDHIKPVFKGGKNEIDNLQPLCKSCNVSKGTKIEDYR